MIEPVHLDNFFIAFFSGAMVVMAGALYALLFAFSRVHGIPRLMPVAYAAYALLAASVAGLSYALNLNGAWQAVAAAMLLGYLLAPHGIWHLCEGTHAEEGHAHDGPAVGADEPRPETPAISPIRR